MKTINHDKITLFKVFSEIPLDIEGSNLDNTGYLPFDEDKQYMNPDIYQFVIEEYNSRNAKVLFKNISLRWDSCDFQEFCCSHDSCVYEIHITNGNDTYEIQFEDGEQLCITGNSKVVILPVVDGVTIYDFIRACELCEIELELSDYAKSLLLEYLEEE